MAVPAGRTGAFRRFTPLFRGPPNIANNATPPVAALWADRNRSGGGSQCGIRSLLPIFRDKAHRKGADGGALCLDHTTDRAPAHKGRGAGWQCALRREGVELRNHHSETYLLCTTAPKAERRSWKNLKNNKTNPCSLLLTVVVAHKSIIKEKSIKSSFFYYVKSTHSFSLSYILYFGTFVVNIFHTWSYIKMIWSILCL